MRIEDTALVAGGLRAGVSDAAVVTRERAPDELAAVILSEDRLRALLSNGPTLAAMAPLPLARFVAEPLFLREEGREIRAFANPLAADGLGAEPALELGVREGCAKRSPLDSGSA